jgi:hypothetical protein
MSKTATVTDADFDVNQKRFLAKLWNEEFFLARDQATTFDVDHY